MARKTTRCGLTLVTEALPRTALAAGMGGVWWARKDLNLGPMDYESTALTAELRALPQPI